MTHQPMAEDEQAARWLDLRGCRGALFATSLLALGCTLSATTPSVPVTVRGEASRPAWQRQVLAHLQSERPMASLPVRVDARGFWLGDAAIESLEELVEFARAEGQAVYRVGGKKLVFDYLRVRYGDAVLYDTVQEFVTAMRENLEHARSGEGGHMNEGLVLGARPLSLVGTLLTYETTWACACAGGPPGSHVAWVSVDLATLRPPEPLALFDEASLVAAMRDDVCIGPTLRGQAPPVSSFEAARSAFASNPERSANCADAEGAFQQIALVDFSPERGRAIVRFGFPHSLAPGHTKTSYFGMELAPLPGFAAVLRRAKEGQGFFMRAHATP